MAGDSKNERKWLVKSSGVVTGPLTFDEITQGLKDRKIVLIDEVRSPDSRWLFIREHKAFGELVKTLRDADSEFGNETVLGAKTVSHTPDEMTTTPTPAPTLVPVEPAPKLEPPPVAVEEEIEKPKLQVYASSADPRVRKKVQPQQKNTAMGAWVALVLVILSLGALYFFNQKQAVRSLGYDDYVKLARENKAIGLFDRSLEFYRKAESIHALDLMNQMQMVPLLMMVENQNVQARQIIEHLNSTGKIPASFSKTAESLIALSYLREGRLEEAQKRYLTIAKNEPSNEAAQINLVEISILQGHFENAAEQITQLMKSGFKDPVLFFLRILTIYRTANEPAKLENAKADLTRLMSQSQDYQAEMQLLMAAIEKKLGQTAQVTESIRKVLQTDPDLTRKHIHEFLIHREVLEWGYLGNICELLVQDDPNSALMKGLAAYCSYEQGDLKAALDKIDKSRTQMANDISLLGLHAFLLYRSGRTSEAKALIQLPKASESTLAMSVKAFLCQDQKDWSCAEQTWEKIHDRNSTNLAAYAGLSYSAFQQGQKEMATDSLKRGLLISNHYQPFLEMKDLLHEQ